MLLRRSNYLLRTIRGYSTNPSPSPKRIWYKELWAKYDKWLEKYPRVYKYHRLMTDGIVHCYGDLKTYVRVYYGTSMRGKELQAFSRQDLEVYLQTSRDVGKLLIIDIFMCMPPPIAEAYFVLMLCFPRYLLTRHFWTPEQLADQRKWFFDHQEERRIKIVKVLSEYAERSGQKELIEFGKVLKSRPVQLDDLRQHAQALSMIPINRLPFVTRYHLIQSQNMLPYLPFSSYTSRLRRRAHLLLVIDSKLAEENLDRLETNELDRSLYLRKLNPASLSEHEKRRLLKDWLSLSASRNIDSVVFHAPISTSSTTPPSSRDNPICDS